MKAAMRAIGILIVISFWLAGATWAQEAGPQEEDLSAGRQWGLGVRTVPSGLGTSLPNSAFELGSAVTVRFWLTELLAVEVGGWISSYSDMWRESTTAMLSGGLLLKPVDTPREDLYVAGRGIYARSSSQDKGGFFNGPPEPPRPETESPMIPPVCCPPSASESSTLAFQLSAGIEWSRSAYVALDVEFGLLYAQTITEQSLPYPPPLPPMAPGEPMPLQFFDGQTSTSVSLGVILQVGVYFYLPRSAGGESHGG